MFLNSQKIEEIFYQCYTDIYKLSTPSAVYDEIIKDEKFSYRDYHISSHIFDMIVNEQIARHKLKSYDAQKIKTSLYLGHAPIFDNLL